MEREKKQAVDIFIRSNYSVQSLPSPENEGERQQRLCLGKAPAGKKTDSTRFDE